MDTLHDLAVQRISAKVKDFHSTKTPFRIYHGSTLSTRDSARRKDQIVDVSALNHVLEFDHDKRRVLVEPNVPMDALVEATLAEGFLPPVVMELPNITVGGGFAGTSGESSSFRYGLFDNTVMSAEIVLGNGDIVRASREDPATRDLFLACGGSCGSLGIVTMLEMQLVDAKSYVELEYVPVSSVAESVKVLEEAEQDPTVDYMDGILYTPTSGIIMLGRLTDTPIPGKKPQTFDHASDPWFYLHAQSILQRQNNENANTPYKETIPTASYFFRYDRAVFWSGRLAFKYFFFTPFNALTRYLLNPFMNTRTMIRALHRSGLSSQGIIQDLAIPYRNAEAFITWTDANTGIRPLWLCPVKPCAEDQRNFSMGNSDGKEMLLNVGMWGFGPRDRGEFVKLNREIEGKVEELGGLKCLYAHAYYTEDEFWRIYDEEAYTQVRRKWHAENLPSVYDKVKVDLSGEGAQKKESWGEWMYGAFWDIYPMRGLYGVGSAVKGLVSPSDFLLKNAK